MRRLNSLTVFLPTFNDAKILPYLICKIYDTVPRLTDDFEVIIIDDGSVDETPLISNSLSKQLPNLKVIRHVKNRGYGGALLTGFQQATKEWVFYTDGDGQYDPHELSKLVSKLKPGIDVVNGYKIKRRDPLIRKIIGGCYKTFTRQIYHLPISDIDCDFRLIRRSLIKQIKLSASSGLICLELVLALKKAGAHFVEVPIHHYPRPFGRSQFFRPKHLFHTLKEYAVFHYTTKIKNS